MLTNKIKKHPKTSVFEVHENCETNFKSMFAGQDLAAGVQLSTIDGGNRLDNPNRYTVQINEKEHLELNPEYLQYINHSCEPNVFFDTTKMVLITLRPITAGEELTFFYPSTEWKMTEPFDCLCQSPHCLGRIGGAAYLAKANIEKYRLTNYVLEKYALAEVS